MVMAKKHTKKMMFLFLIVILSLSFLWTGCIYVSGRGFLEMGQGRMRETYISGKGRDKILVIELKGLITEREKGGLLTLIKEPGSVAMVKEQLNMASGDKRIRGILLLIDSPGGTVTASDTIYHELKTFKEKNNVKIHAFFLGTGASGAYLIAQSADRIMASPTTVTGSIGVIMLSINLSGLMNKVGVSDTTIKSGTFKDIGSPFRKPTKKDEELLQIIVDSQYKRFCKIVEENRPGLNLAERPQLADGRIFTGEQALKEGLVDEVGYLPQALEGMKRAMGVPKARVVRYTRVGEHVSTLYSLGRGVDGGNGNVDINLIKFDVENLLTTACPTFMYLWLPGS